VISGRTGWCLARSPSRQMCIHPTCEAVTASLGAATYAALSAVSAAGMRS
jgi:hypothetical protein